MILCMCVLDTHQSCLTLIYGLYHNLLNPCWDSPGKTAECRHFPDLPNPGLIEFGSATLQADYFMV